MPPGMPCALIGIGITRGFRCDAGVYEDVESDPRATLTRNSEVRTA